MSSATHRTPASSLFGAALDVSRKTGVLDPRWLYSILQASRKHGTGILSGFAAAANRHPHQIALIDERSQFTYKQVYERSLSIAHGLRDLGIHQGAQVGILIRNHAGFVEAMNAVVALGANACLLNTGFAGPQLRNVVEREGISALIFDAEFEDSVANAPASCTRILAWHDGQAAETTLSNLAGHYAPRPLPRPKRPGIATILTSGTTGTPKGARRSSSSSDAQSAVGILEKLPLRVRQRALVSAPLFHSWGFTQLMMGSLLGHSFILQRRFDPENALIALDQHRAELFAVVPVMLQRILALDSDTLDRFETSSLIGTLSSGSALPGELALRWMDRFGENLYNFYGSTEAAQTSIATPSDLREAPGTAGQIPRGTTVQILDDKGQPVPQGQVGRIFVGNGNQFEGYTGGGGKEMADGLMSIGDLGWFDEKGRLFVGGRDDDMIVSGGENVFPREVEDLLSDRPEIHEAAVIGVPDDEFGQRLRGFVVMKAGEAFDEEELKRFIRERLARHKVPREIVHASELPRNQTGKVLKRVLRDWTPPE
ncbi:MAG: AMP-binding protein [Myxococcota bacterium]|nr:AMP-binding protein [Myxococcota bacterium]